MGILPKSSKEQVSEVRKKEQKEKQTMKKVGRMIPHKGHTIFKVHIPTLTVEPATFEKQDFVVGQKKPNRKIVMEKDCVYLSALNKKSLKKKALKHYGIAL